MRRRTRIAVSTAAAGALIAGGGAALAGVPDPLPQPTLPGAASQPTATLPSQAGSKDDLAALRAQAAAEQKHLGELRRMIARANRQIAAAQARREAAAAQAAEGAPPSWTPPQSEGGPGSGPAEPPMQGGVSSEHRTTPPPVQATTGASGTGAPTEESDDSGTQSPEPDDAADG